MTRPAIAVVTIEVDLRAAPITGSVFDAGRIERPFAGWVGLTHALTAVLADAREAIHAEAAGPPSGPQHGAP